MKRLALLRLVEQTAGRILDCQPDPVVRYRLLRDVLGRPAADREVQTARDAVEHSRWVKILAAEQRADGSWGRFHSCDTQAKQKTGTTEGGVERAVALGLDADHPILRRAAGYVSDVLEGRVRVRDPAERNDRWAAGVEMFAAATLGHIDPNLPVLDPVWERWVAILSRVFCNGQFSPDREAQAHRDIHGVRDGVGYLGLANRYAVKLMACRAQRLPRPVERAYAQWLWRRPGGLGYVDVPLQPPPTVAEGHRISGWLYSMVLLCDFAIWPKLAADSIQWLLDQRNQDGLWDFGPRTGALRFSESWRKPGRRSIDHSLMPLTVLRQYADDT